MRFSFIILIILIITPYKAIAEIEYITLNVDGLGKDEKSAIKDALVQALSQVSGVSIDAQTQMDTVEKFTSDGNDKDYFNSDNFQQKVNFETKGVIKEYRILNSKKSSNFEGSWSVQAKVTVAKNKLNKQAQRKRVAVLPFRLAEKDFIINGNKADKNRIKRLFSQNLISYLTQTRKFFLADRDFVEEVMSEKNLINSDATPIEELVKIGNELSADLLVVGVIEDLSNLSVTKKFEKIDKVFTSNKGIVEISFRILDVSTRQIKLSDMYLSDAGASSSNPDTEMIQKASNSIGEYILSSIYPLRVEAIEDEVLYIGQGGKNIKSGDIYRLIQLGKEIKDSYTGESLGKIEIDLGKVEIIGSTSKLSYAKLVDISAEILLGMKINDLILRPAKLMLEDKKTFENIRKEIDNKKVERQEDDEDNW